MNHFRLRYISNKAHFLKTSSDIHAFMFLFFLVTIIRQLKLESGFKNLEIVLIFLFPLFVTSLIRLTFQKPRQETHRKEQKIYN